jgi:hypothetical protein
MHEKAPISLIGRFCQPRNTSQVDFLLYLAFIVDVVDLQVRDSQYPFLLLKKPVRFDNSARVDYLFSFLKPLHDLRHCCNTTGVRRHR